MIRRRESAPKIREQRFHFVRPLTVRLQLRAPGRVELAAQSRFRERPTTAVRHLQRDRRRHSRPAFIEVRTTIVTALAGTHVCLRRVEARAICEAIAREGVTHLCGVPVVMTMLLNAEPDLTRGARPADRDDDRRCAPPAAVIEEMEELGFHITHVYGLTEVYGPAVVCAWHDEWDELPSAERARLKARQGVTYPVLEGLMVADPASLAPVPADGATMGEIFMRGNIVIKGYLKNPGATEEAFAGGWFHSGDLGVMHPDGYIELKDRSTDIIISGGENISRSRLRMSSIGTLPCSRRRWWRAPIRCGVKRPAPL